MCQNSNASQRRELAVPQVVERSVKFRPIDLPAATCPRNSVRQLPECVCPLVAKDGSGSIVPCRRAREDSLTRRRRGIPSRQRRNWASDPTRRPRDGRDEYAHSDTRAVRYRRTDLAIWQMMTGGPPLSVSTDKIALPAMRAAAILSRLPQPVALDGSEIVVEVYPAAALKRWDSLPELSVTLGAPDRRLCDSRYRTQRTTHLSHTTGWPSRTGTTCLRRSPSRASASRTSLSRRPFAGRRASRTRRVLEIPRADCSKSEQHGTARW